MLKKTDRIMTQEEFDSFCTFVNSPDRMACVSYRPCYKCKTVHENGSCFCVGIFTCESCGYENGVHLKQLLAKAIDYKDNKRPSWDEYFLNLTTEIAKRSEDLFIRHGAVLVRDNKILSCGYNGLPKNFNHSRINLKDRDYRRPFMIHAELNAILQCETSCKDSTLYVSGSICSQCLLHCIASGITRVVCKNSIGSITEGVKEKEIKDILIEQSGIKLDFVI